MSIHESTAAYLLHALPDEELAEFEAHLPGCEACRKELKELGVATAVLPVAVEQFAAPPDIKNRLMATVRAEAELLAASGAEADRPPASSRPPRERRQWFSWRPALALACAAVVGVASGIALTGSGDQAVRNLQANVQPAGSVVTMQVREGGRSTLVAKNLPAPPSGRIYQVWIKRRGVEAPEPTDALFTPRGGSASVDVPGSLDDAEAVMVTDEPKGGSRRPTGTVGIVVPT